MVTLKSIAGSAGALLLAVLVLAGCSRDEAKPAPVDPAPVAAADGSLPTPAAPLPTPVASAPGAAPSGIPQDSNDSPLPPPTREPGHSLPDAGSLRVGWLTATVTSDGSGNCYSLKTTDGETWAVYAKKPVPMDQGDQVRVRITPGKTPVSCGKGKPATLVRALISPR